VYKSLFRPLLFQVDPEKAHQLSFGALKSSMRLPLGPSISRKLFCLEDPRLEREVFGLKFPNPVGLAAGFDKDARLVDEFANLGFGFLEIGTLTPKGQTGNPRPRLFRLPQDQAIINRMGFNNQGVERAVERLKKRKSTIIVGGNIGKNKNTSNDEAIHDYLYCFEALHGVVDYFVINVSSPNTPDLRALQEKEPLKRLIDSLQNRNQAKTKPRPLLLKIAPDLNQHQLDDIVQIAIFSELDGIIATNTTVSRQGLSTPQNVVGAIGAGGLSGKPLGEKSDEVLRYLRQNLPQKIRLVGAGGIMTADDALRKLDAGADLIQLYTGLIYEGPGLVKQINQRLLQVPV
jgi:dihydroorotate dehydrogenase